MVVGVGEGVVVEVEGAVESRVVLVVMEGTVS